MYNDSEGKATSGILFGKWTGVCGEHGISTVSLDGYRRIERALGQSWRFVYSHLSMGIDRMALPGAWLNV